MTLAGAESYAAQASRAFGDGPFGVVKTAIATELVTADMRCTVDGGIATIAIPGELLSELDPPEIVRSVSEASDG